MNSFIFKKKIEELKPRFQDLNNVINLSNLNLSSQTDLSRTTPVSVSILSLPNSDSEGFNFANW
jgi:hypothetical protein